MTGPHLQGPASVDMQVLSVLRRRERENLWVTPEEILPYTTTTKKTGVASALRRLRVKGFNIRRKKRIGLVDEYFLISNDPK